MRPFKQMEFGVMRRFSDFLGLHEKLTEKYAKRGRIIPPAPEKSLVRSHISISGIGIRNFLGRLGYISFRFVQDIFLLL